MTSLLKIVKEILEIIKDILVIFRKIFKKIFDDKNTKLLAGVILLILALGIFLFVRIEIAEDIYKAGNNHFYKVFDNKSITWEEARLNCKKLGGHLVTITDSSEQEIVSELIGRQAYWIGAIGGGEHSSFQWITDETFDYTNWADGEPNNVATKENAVMLYPEGSWNDIEKDKTEIAYKNAGKVNMHYICEWDHKYNIIFGRNNSTFSFGF